LLVDVKGRKFPAEIRGEMHRAWQNWSTREDVEGLGRWAERFGPGYRGLLVFAYHILPVVELPPDTADLFAFHGRNYLFRAIDVLDYQRFMRVRSPRWDTVHLPQAVFRELVRPLSDFLLPPFGDDAFCEEPLGAWFQEEVSAGG
jgi:hypothetical protein